MRFQRKPQIVLTIIYFKEQYTNEITTESEQFSIFTIVAYKKSFLKLSSS